VLDTLPLIQFIRVSPLGYPMLEVLHIIGIALLFGTVCLVDLRLLGFGQMLNAQALARFALKLTIAGFLLCGLTGSLMLVSRLEDLLANRVFLIKLGLLTLAACNAAFLHSRNGIERHDDLTRMQAIVSIVLWVGIIGAGRWIAYV
jgi:uncharacterized membrane protein YidH (DUF202 family)